MTRKCLTYSDTEGFSKLTGDYWQLWSMRPDGNGLTQLTESETDKRYPVWIEDTESVLYRTNNNHAYILDLATGQESRLFADLGLIGSLQKSPVTQDFVVVRFRSDVLDNSDLWLVSASGQDRRMLTRDVGLQYDPVWSPDGTRIAFISGHGYQTHELMLMHIDGTHRIELTDNDALELLPMFSPDGERIVYVSDQAGNYDIWVMNLDGSDVQRLTDYPGIDTRPCWSEDGRNIVFVSNRSGELQVWIMRADGSEPTQITHGSPAMDPMWRW